MAEAFVLGMVGGVALLIGAALSFSPIVSKRVLGMGMAFGAGVLMSAVAFDLVEEAFLAAEGARTAGLGLMAGALALYLGDLAIARVGGAHRKRSSGQQAEGNPFGIVLGTVLDGIPESVVLGTSLAAGAGASTAFVVAVFISNLPEGLAGSAGLRVAGWSTSRIFGLWSLVALVSALSAVLGFWALEDASGGVIVFTLAFAAGAVLTMLADTMMPEAFEHGGRVVGLLTTAGFGVAFFLHTLD